PEWYQIPVVTVASPSASVAVTGIASNPGVQTLTGTAVATAQNLLLDLSGSVSGVSLTYNVLRPTDDFFTPQTRIKDYHQNEWGAFFKDDWKIRPDLTLNLGIRYDWYGVPWEKNGMHALPVGGMKGLYGISADPKGTVLQLVGKNSPHPDTLFYNNDLNNFAPAVGLSWSLPWGGKDKTVLRAGYGISYQGAASYNAGLNVASGNNPGLAETQNLTKLGLGNTFLNFSSPILPVPVPPPASTVKPLAPQMLNV